MDFRLFRNFLVVADELHVGRAAERLGIAQPALSQQIKALEERLGVRLFVRANRRIALTEAGEVFCKEARRAVDHADEAIRTAQRTERGEMGKIMVGYISSAMLDPTFPGVLAEFHKAKPEVVIGLRQLVLAEHIEALREQRLDLAVVRGPLSDLPEGFEWFPFMRQSIVAALPQGHSATQGETVRLASLASETFIQLDDPRGSGLAHTVATMCADAGFQPRRSVVVNEVTTIVGLVGAGLGLALVPESASLKSIPGVVHRPLSDVSGFSDMVVMHRRFERSAAVRALLTVFKAHASALTPLPDRPADSRLPFGPVQ